MSSSPGAVVATRVLLAVQVVLSLATLTLLALWGLVAVVAVDDDRAAVALQVFAPLVVVLFLVLAVARCAAALGPGADADRTRLVVAEALLVLATIATLGIVGRLSGFADLGWLSAAPVSVAALGILVLALLLTRSVRDWTGA